jgi:hypothetical protein
MTFAEVIFLVAGAVGIYFLLRPLERWLETVLRRKFSTRHPRPHRTMIDVTDFTSYPSHKKEDHEHHS